MTHHLITLMILLPFIGAVFQAFLPENRLIFGKFSMSRWAALTASFASALCGLVLVISLQTRGAEPAVHETLPWIGSYAISYDMALDGLNTLLVLLISISFPLLIASEWTLKTGIRGFFGLLLVLQSSFLGAVCAQDLFLLFFFWALSALPFYFLIGIWGGENRERAAFRMIVSSAIGNALLFSALILVYYALDPHSFSIRELSGGKLAGATFDFFGNVFHVSDAAFLLISAGLALRAPIWPFHGWFTLAAEEAPSSVFAALSAVSVPVATYIFTRLSYSLFPATVLEMSSFIVGTGAISLIMGGLCAMAQRGLRLLAAFICLSEAGLVLIGIGSLNPAGIVGSVYHQLVLGLGLVGMALLTGILFERSGTILFQDDKGESVQSGIVTHAPRMAMIAGIIIASLLGFPGLGGFVGHALLLIGSYSIHPLVVVVAALVFLFASWFLFAMYRHLFLGRTGDRAGFPDLTMREKAFLLPLVGGLLLFGIYPKPMIELIRPTVTAFLTTINQDIAR